MKYRERKIHLLVLALAGLTATLLQIALHLRPGPLGAPYSETPFRSLLTGAAWDWLALAALAAPFVLLGPFLWSRKHPKSAQILRYAHVAAAFAALTAGHAEHELQRFMGTHLTIDYLATYGRLGHSPGAISFALARDAGGAYSGLCLAALPVLFLLAAFLSLSRRRSFFRRPSPGHGGGRSTGLLAVALIVPPAGAIPKASYPAPSPPARTGVGVLRDAVVEALGVPGDPPSSVDFQTAREIWRVRNGSDDWAFTDARHPLWRVPKGPCPAPPERPWNFVVVQLETFRAMDMRHFNPQLEARPTPFLDDLARDPKSTSWVRFYTNGVPTVSAFMAIHTSLLPHSRKRVATAFRHLGLDAFPSILRKEGYRAVFMTGADPDWDGQRRWAETWYDEVLFDPRYDGRDNHLLDDAAKLLLELGSGRRPFVVTVVTSTNHLPFRLPGQSNGASKELGPRQRLHRTMAFTDEALKEFFGRIRDADWFDRTVFILTGDHGYDLGERGISGRLTNLRHENTWVPLITHGAHPSLPRGRIETVSSHLDLAPTILALAGTCRPNAFYGHDLTRLDASAGFALTIREGALALETEDFSFYFPPNGEPEAYGAEDRMQRRDIFWLLRTDFADFHENLASGLSRVFDGLYETESVRPPPRSTPR